VIAAGVVEEIRDLLAEGALSQRKIAQRMGVSRGTVNAIARGRRPVYASGRRVPGIDFIPPSGRPVRCPGCGGMVQMPCLLCYLRAIGRRERLAGRSLRQAGFAGVQKALPGPYNCGR
jgi:transcriptional regulator with XRE-family HTH domain